jgi:hypothetical protein
MVCRRATLEAVAMKNIHRVEMKINLSVSPCLRVSASIFKSEPPLLAFPGWSLGTRVGRWSKKTNLSGEVGKSRKKSGYNKSNLMLVAYF